MSVQRCIVPEHVHSSNGDHEISHPCSSLDPYVQGDPSAVPYAVQQVQELLGQKPIFGICMGHQLLGQAFGGKTFKLKFGHHGGNHPVRHNSSGPPAAARV